MRHTDGWTFAIIDVFVMINNCVGTRDTRMLIGFVITPLIVYHLLGKFCLELEILEY